MTQCINTVDLTQKYKIWLNKFIQENRSRLFSLVEGYGSREVVWLTMLEGSVGFKITKLNITPRVNGTDVSLDKLAEYLVSDLVSLINSGSYCILKFRTDKQLNKFLLENLSLLEKEKEKMVEALDAFAHSFNEPIETNDFRPITECGI